jgi:hypothetical protein
MAHTVEEPATKRPSAWCGDEQSHFKAANGKFGNSISFHHHNGEMDVTSLFFNNIMESSISGIFPPFVFNNIMKLTFIFSPRVFSLPGTKNELTILVSMI